MPKKQAVKEEDHVTFESGAKRSKRMPRYDLLPKIFLERTSSRFEMGLKYGEHNYKKGLPFEDTFNHILDHLLAYRELMKEYGRLTESATLQNPLPSREDWVRSKQQDGDDLAGAAWGIAALMYLESEGTLL